MLLTLLEMNDGAAVQYFMVLNAILVLCASVYVFAAMYDVIGRMSLRYASLISRNRNRKGVSRLGDDDGV